MYEKYIDERNKNDNEDYRLYKSDSGLEYILEVHRYSIQNYVLEFKKGRDNPLYYADEVINQIGNLFVYYKPYLSHYRIRNVMTNEEWQIQKKETCVSICHQLNRYAFELSNAHSITNDFIRILNKIQKYFTEDNKSVQLNKQEYKELHHLCNVARDMILNMNVDLRRK